MTLPGEEVPATKQCRRCGETKPLTAFPRDRRSPDGHKHWCKVCNNAAAREYYYRETPATPPKWVALHCEVCGKEMRYRRSEIESRQRRGRPLPRFCSRRCATRDLHRRRREAL